MACQKVIQNCLDSRSKTDAARISDDAHRTFNALLKTELFGPDSVDTASLRKSPSSRSLSATGSNTSGAVTPSSPSSATKVFSFTSPSRRRPGIGERERVIGGAQGLDSPTHQRYSLSPVRHESQKLLLSPKKASRQLSKVPYKVLDAPELAVSIEPRIVYVQSADLGGSHRMTITSI